MLPLKLHSYRRAIRYTQQLINTEEPDFSSLKGCLICNPPNENIYEFTGQFRISENDETHTSEPLNLENTMWANTILTSGKIVGLVVYTGRETRSVMNSRAPRTKIGVA